MSIPSPHFFAYALHSTPAVAMPFARFGGLFFRAFDMSDDFEDTSTMLPHRQTDHSDVIRVSRVIPLWGIVTALGIFAANAASMYYGQLSQGEKLISLQANTVQMNSKLDTITSTQNKADLKDLEHDYKLSSQYAQITALTARMVDIESTLKSQQRGNK